MNMNMNQVLSTLASCILFFLSTYSVSALNDVSRQMKFRKRPLQVQMRTGFIGSSLKSLLDDNRSRLSSLASISPDMSEISLLRYTLQFPNQDEAESALKETVKWRNGSGRYIIESAAKAVAAATAAGGWENEPVRASAPYAAKINQFITSKNILTISMGEGDLVYVIRASAIDDKALMNDVSVNEFVEFLLYVKEVHSLIVNARSEKTGRLCGVLFANDISGTRSVPDKRFSQALTASSQQVLF